MSKIKMRVKREKSKYEYVVQYETRYNKNTKRTEQFNTKNLGVFTGKYDEQGNPQYIPANTVIESSYVRNIWGLVEDYVKADPFIMHTPELSEIFFSLSKDIDWLKKILVLPEISHFSSSFDMRKHGHFFSYKPDETVEIAVSTHPPHRVYLLNSSQSQDALIPEEQKSSVIFTSDGLTKATKKNIFISKSIFKNQLHQYEPLASLNDSLKTNDIETLSVLISAISILPEIKTYLYRPFPDHLSESDNQAFVQICMYALINILLPWSKFFTTLQEVRNLLKEGRFINIEGVWRRLDSRFVLET